MTAPFCVEFRAPEEHKITPPAKGSYLRALVLLTFATVTLVFCNIRAIGQSASVIPSAKIATGAVPTLKAQVQEVPLVLSVTDHKGKYVDGLAPSDLTILDNDHEQTAVTFFEHQTNLPLSVAIIIDASSSVANRFSAEQSTIKSFTIARPTDSVNVFASGTGSGTSGNGNGSSGSSGSTPPQK